MFKDRMDAGHRLADEVKKLNPQNPVVLCIPRGGVVVGNRVAQKLAAPLDVIIPRKIGLPLNSEVAIGAVAQDGTTYFDERYISFLGIEKDQLDELIEKEIREIERRMSGYRGSTDYPDYRGKTIILIDDGAATGYTMLAAAKFARKTLSPGRLLIAVPVAPQDTLEHFGEVSDEVVCLHAPNDFYAVGQFYCNFSQTTDKEVLSILSRFKTEQLSWNNNTPSAKK